MRYRHTQQFKLDDREIENPLTNQMKSFECSSVYEQQPLYESGEMSWLAPLVNGIERESPVKPFGFSLEDSVKSR